LGAFTKKRKTEFIITKYIGDNQMELMIRIPQNLSEIAIIENNLDELIADMNVRLEKYKNLVYNENQIKDAKSDRATLNGLKSTLNTARIQAEKDWMKPIEEVKSKMKKLDEMIVEASSGIDSQVKKYEEKIKNEKEAKINEIVGLHINTKLVRKELIFDKKWLNAGTKLDSIEKAIIEFSDKIKSDTDTIEGLNSKYYQQMLDKYYQTLNINDAIAEERRLQSFEKNIAEAEIKKEIEKPFVGQRIAVEAIEYAQAEGTIFIPAILPDVVYNATVTEELTVLDFRVWVTTEQKQLLKEFLKNNNIKYGKVE
jgi:hypothetical protein